MTDTDNTARLHILSKIVSFPTIRGTDWEDCLNNPNVGDLVALSCARPSKWYLSWVDAVEVDENKFPHFLLRSIEDHEQIWWTNVGLHRWKEPDENWRWSDRQFAFYYRWHRVVSKQDHWLIRAAWTSFDGDAVTLRLRKAYDMREVDRFLFERTFPNWKKTTKAMMAEFFAHGCAAQEADEARVKAEREAQS